MPIHDIAGLALLAAAALHAETGYEAWLRYAPAKVEAPTVVSILDDSPLARSAQSELIRGIRGMSGRTPRAESGVPKESGIVLGTLATIRREAPQWGINGEIGAEG